MPGEGGDSVIMILPGLKDGGLEVIIGLGLGVMEKLLDDEFTKLPSLESVRVSMSEESWCILQG